MLTSNLEERNALVRDYSEYLVDAPFSEFCGSLEARSFGPGIRNVFDRHCKHIKFDNNFVKLVKQFDVGFVTKNADHISFYGSGLLGVYPIRWVDDDRNRWLDDVMQIDEIALQEDIASLDSIDTSRQVTSDIMNLSVIYLCHKLMNAQLPESKKEEGMIAMIRILHHKYLSSLLSHFFPYPADESVAKATNDALSNKFDIKRYGNWNHLLTKRAEDVISRKSIHYDTFKFMREDYNVQYAVSDMQTRIRAVVKAQTAVFYQIKDSGQTIRSTSQTVMVENELIIKDVSRSYSKYYRYLQDIVPERRDFIRAELCNIIINAVPSASPKAFITSLEFISDNVNDKKFKYIQEFLSDSTLYAFSFIADNALSTKDLANIIERMRAMYTGSRIVDKRILELRKVGDKIVLVATGRKKSVPCAPERTAVLLYLILRILTMDNYR